MRISFEIHIFPLGIKVIAVWVISILMVLSVIVVDSREVSFQHLTMKNGLSDGRVDCILQDRQGFLWFGTQDGLNRFDGNNLTVYYHDPFDTLTISSSWIRCLLEDREGNLWIGTEGGGLNRFEPSTGTFKRWLHQPDNPNSLDDNFVRALIEDSFGTIWVGTRAGLQQFDRKQGIFHPLRAEQDPHSNDLFDENVTKILEDQNHNLWIGTPNDIYIYNRQQHKIQHLPFSGGPKRITDIAQDKDGAIWIGTRYHGLIKYDPIKGLFHHYRASGENGCSIYSDEIKAIFEDREHNLWVGTFHGGLLRFLSDEKRFEQYRHHPGDPSSLSSNSVRVIYQDRSGIMWLGMDGSGIDWFINLPPKFQINDTNAAVTAVLRNYTILSLLAEGDEVLWIGSEGGGLSRFDRKKGLVQNYRSRQEDAFSLSHDHVTCLYRDKDGSLWVGTKEGLNRFDERNKMFERYYIRLNPITGNNYINMIAEDTRHGLILATNGGVLTFDKTTHEFQHLNYDSTGILNYEMVVAILATDTTLWLGYLRSGLVDYNLKTQSFIHYRNNMADPYSLSSNFVQYIYGSNSGQLWIATRNGLNLLDPIHRSFTVYTKADGLPSNVVVGILEDEDGDLWLGTTNGLSRFNPKEKVFLNYDVADGLQGNQFWNRSCCRSKTGEMFFGGNNGYNAFYPAEIKNAGNAYQAPIVISSIKVSDGRRIRTLLAWTDEEKVLELSHRENQISFEFAALDFRRPDKNQYAYRLHGLDNDWVYAGNRRYVNYTNLKPGTYTFHVKGSNSDGIWNERGTQLRFHIATPYWRRWWAYLLYSIAFILFLYGVNAYIIGLVRIKHDLKIERMEKEKEKELHQFKLQFFTDVAHEFKTPLTLIQAPLDEILSKVKTKSRFYRQYRLMQRNVQYLLRLVHQLLAFRRAEQGHLELKVSSGDIVQFAEEIYELFTDTAQRRRITYHFSSASPTVIGWFDWEKIEEIFINLLDNAFKYTPDHGKITLRLETVPSANGDARVLLQVDDNGVGIAADKLDKVFDRFYRGERPHAGHISSGLGLALTKKLVELHHGTILVESQEGRGSCFKVLLPLGKQYFHAEEIIEDISETSHFRSLQDVAIDLGAEEKPARIAYLPTSMESDKALILLVEDDRELRTYMRKTLSAHYRVVEAEDGCQGWELAQKILPNIVICDVIMPHMDGIELCRRIKNTMATSHIPVILLTAQETLEMKITGMDIGADDYIEKPFHFRFLLARIKNILTSRQKLREKFQRELLLEPAAVPTLSAEEDFLARLKAMVEEKLADADLDVQQLAVAIGLSRTMLFVKLKELTGYSPKEFIRIMRLKKAAQLLKNTDDTISEIAYRVGFKYPKHFGVSFRKYFGKTPSQYRS